MGYPSNWDVGMDLIRERLRSWVHGPCTAVDDLDDLKNALEYAGYSMHAAERVSAFAGRQGARERLRGARQRIDSIVGLLERSQDVCQDLGNIEKIRNGVEELRQIGNVANNPARAAHAFGQLLSGLGDLSRHLPFPANTYAEWLAASGDFFTNMLSALDPGQRWRGRQDGRYLNNSYANP